MSLSILSRLQVELVRYGMSTVLVLGVIGNLFVTIIFIQRRQSSCSLYLSGLATLNTLGLSFLIPINVYDIDHPDPTAYSLVLCKLRFYFSHAWGQLARYMMVLACIDRFALTTNDPRFQVIQRPNVARWIMGIFIIFYHIFIIHLPILTTISNGRCNQFGVYYIIYQVHVLIFLSLIPPVSMTVFGYLAYRNIGRLYARVRPVETGVIDRRNIITVYRHDRDYLKMVLIETIVYVATMSIYPFILLEISITTYLSIIKSTEHIQIESFLSTFSTLLIHMNSGISFYLYLIVSKLFRRDFKKFLVQLKHRVFLL